MLKTCEMVSLQVIKMHQNTLSYLNNRDADGTTTNEITNQQANLHPSSIAS